MQPSVGCLLPPLSPRHAPPPPRAALATNCLRGDSYRIALAIVLKHTPPRTLRHTSLPAAAAALCYAACPRTARTITCLP